MLDSHPELKGILNDLITIVIKWLQKICDLPIMSKLQYILM